MEDLRFNGGMDFKITNVGYICVTRKKNFSFDYLNGKDKFTFVFVKSGKMKYEFLQSGETILLTENEMLFIPRYLPYKSSYMEDGTVAKTISFDVEGQKIPSYFASVPTKKSSHEYTAVFSSVTNLNMRNTLFLASKVYELLYLIQSKRRFLSKNQKKILPALDEICKNYAENKKLSFYAQMCNMSESNFRKLFKECTGISPIEYRNRIRISEAKKLIDSGEFTVTEAAYSVGFNNMSFFYELYRKRTHN